MAVSTQRLEPPARAQDCHDRSVRDGPLGVALWRRQSDAVNERLLDRWLPAEPGWVLKTDLYDEVVSAGLYPALQSRAEQVTGVDISPDVAAAAAERHPGLDARVADVRRLPFDSGSFDAVVSNSTLDHFDDRRQVELALAEIDRVLRPGGSLIVTLDNPLNPLLALRNRLPAAVARRLRRGFPYEAGWTCGPRELRTLLAGSGLSLRSETAILHAPRGVVALVDRRSLRGAERMLVWLLAAERLEEAPTRYLTGHFIAALATKGEALEAADQPADV